MRKLAALVVSTLVSTGLLSAQSDAQRAPGQQPQATFKSGVDLVTLSVAVRTDNGKVVRDLQKSDFTVLDSGRPAKIADFYVGDSAISLAILLDISGSMAVGGNMDRAREAVNVATMSLRTRTDEAAMLTFDTELRRSWGSRRIAELDPSCASSHGTPWGRPLSTTRSCRRGGRSRAQGESQSRAAGRDGRARQPEADRPRQASSVVSSSTCRSTRSS